MDKNTKDKKELIFQAALELFNKNGIDRTPTALISKEAGVATGTLFHYFSSKEVLVNELYLRCKDDMVERLQQGLEGETGYRGKFRRIFINILRWGSERQDVMDFFQLVDSSPLIMAETRERGKQRFAFLEDFIEEGIDGSIIKPVNADYLYHIVFGIIRANLDYIRDHPELLENEEFLEKAFCYLWDSIRYNFD